MNIHVSYEKLNLSSIFIMPPQYILKQFISTEKTLVPIWFSFETQRLQKRQTKGGHWWLCMRCSIQNL